MSSYTPLVSILVPVYNASLYLRACLDSIINQSYRNLQIVLIDDGSRDDSLSICQHYASVDDRIEVYTQENQGVAITRNHLLMEAKGDYVLFIDSDDWVELDMIEYLISLTNECGADIVMCDKLVNETLPSSKITINTLAKDVAIRDFLVHKYFDGSLWNKLLKRDVLLNVTFQSGISYGEDALFVWDILQNIAKVVITTKQLYHYRINDTSLSHNYNGHQFSALNVWNRIVQDVETYYPEYLDLARAQFCNQMTIILYGAARNGYKYDNNVGQLCDIVKKYRTHMRRTNCSLKKNAFAFLISRHYKIMKIILSI
jgi:glycosyltransferase involved in cell wall biosynthesis